MGNAYGFLVVTCDELTRKVQTSRLEFLIDLFQLSPARCGSDCKAVKEGPMVLVRQEIGDVLRDFRLQKRRTLRQVAGKASVALGYLSEVERGQKEASSEILASVADALETPISVIMREVGDRLAVLEGIDPIPDTVPDEFVADFDIDLVSR